MCLLSNEVSEIRPMILGMRSLAGFWSLLAPRVVDSQ